MPTNIPEDSKFKSDKEVQDQPCEECGGECETTSVGYSCPLCYFMGCKKCGKEHRRQGVEGIREMTDEEYYALHPERRPKS